VVVLRFGIVRLQVTQALVPLHDDAHTSRLRSSVGKRGAPQLASPTVEAHAAGAMKKLGAFSRTPAPAIAVRRASV
jgi:hypothetical protein